MGRKISQNSVTVKSSNPELFFFKGTFSIKILPFTLNSNHSSEEVKFDYTALALLMMMVERKKSRG